jgi:hypothetical protein
VAKSKTFRSDAEGPISVAVPGQAPVRFVPGETRTIETDDPNVIAALEANPNVSVEKGKKK